MKKSSLVVSVGSLGAMLLGITQGCGTNEAARGDPSLLEGGAGDARVLVDDGGGGPIGSRTPIGKPCLEDRECGGRGIICLSSDSKVLGGGGPPNGLCAADCASDVSLCRRLDPGAVCVAFSATAPIAYCLQGCAQGPVGPGEEKCHNRADVACYQGTTDTGAPGASFCRPQCRNDADCGTRKCDFGSGACKDAKDIGTLPIGSPCDPALAEDPCTGLCGPLTDNDAGTGPGVCFGYCPIGSIGCGTDPRSAAPFPAACLFAISEGAGVGDTGVCRQLCDCNDDCKVEGWVCRPFTDPGEISTLRRDGYCGGDKDTAGKVVESIACGALPRDGGSTPSADGAAPVPVDGGPDAR